MIKLRRGKTSSWRNSKVLLEDGQPGYDKTRNKVKIGNGSSTWDELPFASGLHSKEILDSDKNAQERIKKDNEDTTLITYGTHTPDKDTQGKFYLQYYDTNPEVDYIVNYGVNGIWTYQIWNSGFAKCWGSLPLTTTIKGAFSNNSLFGNDTGMNKVSYPFTFESTPVETATIQSAKNKLVWLANAEANSTTKTGLYHIISGDKQESAIYNITFMVEGIVKESVWKK